MAPDGPKPQVKAAPQRDASRSTGQVVPLAARLMSATQPADLKPADATKIVKVLAAKTENIVVISYGRRKAKQRRITRRQIELCVQKGTLSEGPFVNQHGHWQMNLCRHAAGEHITCVVAIEWATRILVINAF
jgi:hypothetical protein